MRTTHYAAAFLFSTEATTKLESLKMSKMIFVLALMVAVASTQPIETIATSGGVSLSTQLWNWGQAAFEALVALVVKAFEPVEPSRDETSK